MFRVRWRAVVTVLTASILFILLAYQGYVPLLNIARAPLYGKVDPDHQQRFNWRNVPVHFPLQRLRLLPDGKPNQLPRIQYQFEPETGTDRQIRLERKATVKDAFLKCYRSYRERAWLKDELAPISGKYNTMFGGWAATLVDSLDTLWIMGMKTEFDEAVRAVEGIDFTNSTETEVNVFETTIRYLGGFLSAYDLSNNKILLHKAIEVGEMLLVAFDTPNHMPVSRWPWQDAINGKEQVASWNTLLSELASLSLEFTRLSQITEDPRWYDAIARITDLLESQQSRTQLPGMWPININTRDMITYTDSSFSIGGMADSTYEYLPKMYALLGGLEPAYIRMYKKAMNTIIKNILFRPMTPANLDILVPGNLRVDYTGHQLDTQLQHLGCFAGGMFALGGKLLNMPSHITIAQKLTHGCIWAYNSSAIGIMPETSLILGCPSTNSPCPWDEYQWQNAITDWHAIDQRKGSKAIIREKRLPPTFISFTDPRYILRPEAIESIFILYRVTGDKSLLESAWAMFQAIQTHTSTEYGNAELEDVTYPLIPPRKIDRMESFWMAETLKYFYLCFEDTSVISLDEFVFNTEAHPFRRPGMGMRKGGGVGA